MGYNADDRDANGLRCQETNGDILLSTPFISLAPTPSCVNLGMS